MVIHHRETYCKRNRCVGKSPQKCKQLQADNKLLTDKIALALLEIAHIEGEKTPTEKRIEQILKEKE